MVDSLTGIVLQDQYFLVLERNLFTIHDQLANGSKDYRGDEGWGGGNYFRSSVLVTIQKSKESINGLDTGRFVYVPMVKILKYKMHTWSYEHSGTSDRNAFRATIVSNDYAIATTIPEKEWDFKAKVVFNQDTNNYDVKMIINGNEYKTKVTTGLNLFLAQGNIDPGEQYLLDYPPFSSNSVGAASYIYNLSILGRQKGEYTNNLPDIDYSQRALKSEICDLTYTLDEYKHEFSFDSNSSSVASNLEDVTDIVAPISMNLNGIGYASTYCGPKILDSDNDGITDALDNCIFTFNPDQKDIDHDGVGDVCDNCPQANPADPVTHIQLDTDGDGVGDSCDNCYLKYNPRIASLTTPGLFYHQLYDHLVLLW